MTKTKSPSRVKKVVVKKRPEPKPVKPVKKIPKKALAIETVTSGMKKPCDSCEELPEGKRLSLKKGGGRFGKTEIYCILCGAKIIERLSRDLESLANYLTENE